MNTTKLSDAEIHARAIEGLRSMTREEWQARLDEAAVLFGGREATSPSDSDAQTPGKYRLRGWRRLRTDVVLNGSQAKSAKPSKKKPSLQTAQA